MRPGNINNFTLFFLFSFLPIGLIYSQEFQSAKKSVTKPFCVYLHNSNTLSKIPLDDSLKITTEPETQIVPSLSSGCFFITFEENVSYRINFTYPGCEDQFLEFNTSQIPVYDTLFSLVFSKGTPYYYTSHFKRWYEPDSLSIIILGDRYYKKTEFDQYISDLGLVSASETYSNYFHKKSGEPFDFYNDSILVELRKPSPIIEAAGINVGTPESISLLTNRIQIEWRSTDQNAIDAILKSYKLKEIGDGSYEASEGIGFGINIIAEELNQKPEVRLAYPEVFHVIYPD